MNVGEVLDVLESDRALLRDEGLADGEILEIIAEGMPPLLDHAAPPLIQLCVTRDSMAGEPCRAVRCM